MTSKSLYSVKGLKNEMITAKHRVKVQALWKLIAGTIHDKSVEWSLKRGKEIEMNFYRIGTNLLSSQGIMLNPMRREDMQNHRDSYLGKCKYLLEHQVHWKSLEEESREKTGSSGRPQKSWTLSCGQWKTMKRNPDQVVLAFDGPL